MRDDVLLTGSAADPSGKGDRGATPRSIRNVLGLPVVRRRHPLQWIGVVVVVVLATAFFAAVLTNENMQWPVVRHYLFHPLILGGVRVTVELTLVSIAIGIALGIVVAIFRMSTNRAIRLLASAYIQILRSIPLLVQLVFWFNIALLFPRINVTLPGLGWGVDSKTNDLISSFTAAVIGLSLHESSLMAEVIRGGILSVGRGQVEAAKALGMKRSILHRIVLPQAMRAIIPATGNQLVTLLKATSLVAFIAGGDMMTQAQHIYATNFQVIPLLLVVSIWYLALVIVASAIQHLLEKRYGRGF